MSISKFADGMFGAQKDLAKFGKLATDVGASLTKAITLPIVGIGISALKASGEFESAMLRVTAKLGLTGEASGEATAKLEALALKLGADTVFSAGEAAAAMENLVAAGFNVEQVMSVLPAVLALAATENMGLQESATLVTAALKGYGFEAGDAARVVDILAKASIDSASSAGDLGAALVKVGPVASGFKLDFNEIISILALMADAGINGAAAGTALSGAIGKLAKPVGDGATAIKEMNLRIFDSPGVMRPMKEILAEIAGTADPASTALRIFGLESGPEMIAAMNQGIPKIKEFERGLDDAGGTAERVGKAQMGGFMGALEALKGSWETLGIVMGKSGFLKWATDAIRGITEWVNVLATTKPEMLAPFLALAGLLAAAGPVMLGIGIVAKALSKGGILHKGLEVFAAAMKLSGKAIALLWSPKGAIVGSVLLGAAILIHTWKEIESGHTDLEKGIKRGVDDILVKSLDANKKRLESDKTLSEEQKRMLQSWIADGEKQKAELDKSGRAHEGFADRVKASVAETIASFGELVPAIEDTGEGMNTALIGKALPKLTAGAKAWFTDFITTVRTRTGDAVSAFTNAISPLSQKMSDELAATKTAWENKFKDLIAGIQHDGKQVFDDFTAPIENIADAVKGFAENAMNAWRDAVKSPSAVAAFNNWEDFWKEVANKTGSIVSDLASDIATVILTGDGSIVDTFKKAGEALLHAVITTIVEKVLDVLISKIEFLDNLLGGGGGLGKASASASAGSSGSISSGLVDLGDRAGTDTVGRAVQIVTWLLQKALLRGGAIAKTAGTIIGEVFGKSRRPGAPGQGGLFGQGGSAWSSFKGPSMMNWFLAHGFPGGPGFINFPWNPGGFVPPGPGGKPGFGDSGGGGWGGDWGGGGVSGGGAMGLGVNVSVNVHGSVWQTEDLAEAIRKRLITIFNRTGNLGFA